jgi:uncharacterized membrane protein (Fun14 family)
MKEFGEKAFYSLFLAHFLIVLYAFYWFAVSLQGVGLWICAGIGFFCGFMQLYAPKNIIKSLLMASAPLMILFLISYFYYQDFRIMTEAQRATSGIFNRSINHLTVLNTKVFNNFKAIFISETRLSHWLALIFGFFLARILSTSLLNQYQNQKESNFDDGSILNKRYESKSNRFKRRF